MHIGIAAAILAEDFRQNIKAGSFVGSNHQSAAGRLAVVCHGYERFIAQLLHAQRVLVKDLSGRGKLDRLSRSIEQAVAVLLLELANLRADCRLRAENFLSRAREAALAGNLQKGDELIEIHGEL